jgi:malate synthase
MTSYGFHPGAAEEYLAATQYYLEHVSPLIAAAFVAEVESAIQTLLAAPTRWGVIEEILVASATTESLSAAVRIRFQPSLRHGIIRAISSRL